MNTEKLVSLLSRLLFAAAFLLLGLAVVERIANAAGYTILQIYSGGRLLESAAVLLVFVIAVQLREMKEILKKKP